MTTHFNIIELYYVESIGKNVLLVSSYDVGYSVITVIDDKPFIAIIGEYEHININNPININIEQSVSTSDNYLLHFITNTNTNIHSSNIYYSLCMNKYERILARDIDKFIRENIDLIEGKGSPILK